MAGMQPEDLFELRWAGDPRLSPDGRTVAYTLNTIDREANEYASSIWLAAVDGSGAPRQLTSGEKKDACPRWSPDGSTIAFVSTRASKPAQVFVIPVAGGEARKLTDLKESAGELAWSPDGTRIAFTSRVRDAAYDETDERKRAPRRFRRLMFKLDTEGWIGDRRKHLFVLAADGSAPPVQLTHGDFEHGGPAWSPDGSRIAFVSSHDDDWDITPVSDVYAVAADGSGEAQKLTASDGNCGGIAWSPDGSEIAHVFTPGVQDDPHHGRIAVVDATGGARRVLTESLDRNCAPYPPVRELAWNGDEIVFGVEDRGNTHLYRVAADGNGKPEPLIEGELAVTGFDVAAGTLVHTATHPTGLADVFAGERRLTDAGTGFGEGRDLVHAERFTAASADGTEVDAWVVRPAGFKQGERYPALLNVHGGPFTQYGNRFFDEFQVQAGAGYVVLFANPRGSSGYSEAWGRAIRGPGTAGPGMGTVDYDDVMAVVDTALEQFDFIDPERLGIIGGSYGGYMTSWVVSHTDRFTAAISERAVNDWHSMWGSSDVGWDFTGYVGRSLYEDPEAWRAMSPATYATNITTPLMILHSENDLRCNIEQAEQLFTTLRLLKRDVELVRFPAESHELSRAGAPAHRLMRFEIILEFFARYLQRH